VRATLRGIRYAKSNKQESVRSIMKWAEMDLALAQGGYDIAVSSWSDTGAANPQRLQMGMAEIRTEQKLDASPIPTRRSIGLLSRSRR
jgi:hypothetical protein